MATTAKLTLRGLDEYLEKVAAAGRNIDEAAKKAVAAGAEVIETGMKERAAELTGKLKDNIITVGPTQDGDVIAARVGVIAGKSDPDTVRYGNAQEYGTASMPAHPYVRPTIDQDGAKAKAAMRDVLKEEGML